MSGRLSTHLMSTFEMEPEMTISFVVVIETWISDLHVELLKLTILISSHGPLGFDAI